MNGSFNAIAQNLNVQRLYEKAFDQVMISTTPLWQFIAGQIIGGSLRGLYAGGIILLLTMPIGTGLVFNGWSLLVMFLNGAVFSAIGVVVSFLAKNHADVPRFSNYIIMPMAFLCNTFFSTEKIPGFLGNFVAALPLSQTSHLIRTIASGGGVNYLSVLILTVYLIAFSIAAVNLSLQKNHRLSCSFGKPVFFISYTILAIVCLDVLFSSSHDHISTCKKGCHCQCGHSSDR